MFGQLIEEIRLEARGEEKRRRQAASAAAVGVKMGAHPGDVNKSLHVGKGAFLSRQRRKDRSAARSQMSVYDSNRETGREGETKLPGGRMRIRSREQMAKDSRLDTRISRRKPGGALRSLQNKKARSAKVKAKIASPESKARMAKMIAKMRASK